MLYEMISGQRAFQRDTAVETLTAILREEPPEDPLWKTRCPLAVDRIVRHCLEKRANERFQSARDLAFDLHAAAVHAVVSSGSSMAWVPATGRWRQVVAWVATAGLVVAVIVVVGALVGRRLASVPPPSFHQLTFNRGVVRSARFSPDGETFVYGAAWNGRPFELYSARTDGVGARSFGLPPGDLLGIFDHGDMALLMGHPNLDYLMGVGTLARSHVSGSPQREILDGVSDGDVARDGTAFAIVRRIGGRDRLEFPVDHVLFSTEGWIQHPRVSADGTHVAFLEHPLLGDDRGFVAVVDRQGRAKRLTEEWSAVQGLAWSATGGEVWFTAERGGEGTALYSVNLAGTQRIVFAAPVQLQLQDISRTGAVLLVANRNTSELVAHSATEPSEHFLDLFGQLFVTGLSSDGTRLAFTYVGPLSGTDYSVCVVDMKGGAPVRLGEGWACSMSPDGKWILTLLPSAPGRFTLLPTGAGERRDLDLAGVRPSNDTRLPQSWTSDSREVLFTGREQGGGARAYLLDLPDGKPRAVTPEDFTDALVAPDGRAVLARAAAGGFFLLPTAGGPPRPVQSIGGDEEPIQFDPSGDTVYVWNGVFPAQVDRVDLTTGRRGKWRVIAPPDPAGVQNGTIALTPDGRTYVYRYRRLQSELFLVSGLR